VPVMTMLTLNSEMPLIPDDTLSVNAAEVDAPGASVVLSLFQVIVIGPLAPLGFQPVLVMLNVIWLLPVFLT
jgi:hypothetical protein